MKHLNNRYLHINCAIASVATAFALLSSSAHGAYVAVAGSASTPVDISARARNGESGFEGVLFTPGNPAPTGLQMNPVGNPAWSYGEYAGFSFAYNSTTGSATWSIDFNRDGDFLDSEESVTSLSPSLAYRGFNQVSLFLQGNDSPLAGASIVDFTLNGTNFGAFTSSNGTATTQLFTYAGGGTDILATGSLMFTASGGSQERPRFWIQAGSSFAVPTPGAMALLGLAGLAKSRRRR